MKQGQKIDEKTISKIITLKIENPTMSERAIQRRFPYIKSNKTINNILKKEFTQNTQDYCVVTDSIIHSLLKGQQILNASMKNLQINNSTDFLKFSKTLNHILNQLELFYKYGNHSDNVIKKGISSSLSIYIAK